MEARLILARFFIAATISLLCVSMLPHLAFPEVSLLQYESLTRSKKWAILQFGDQVDGWRELKTSFWKNGTIQVSNGESSLTFQVPCTSLEANESHVLLKGQFDAWFDFKSLDNGIKITILGTATSTTNFQFEFSSTFQRVNYTLWSGSVGFSFEDAKSLNWSIGKTVLRFAVDGKFSIDPSLVDNSTSLYAVATPQQRGQFYGSGYHYFFYTNGTNFGFRSSTDGLTWGSFIDCPTSGETTYGNRFDVTYDNNTGKVAYVIANISKGTNRDRLFFRQGTLDGSGGLTWDAVEQKIYSVGADDDYIELPSISFDSGGYVWVAFRIIYAAVTVIKYRIYLLGNTRLDGVWADRFYVLSVLANTISALVAPTPQVVGLTTNSCAVVFANFQINQSIWCRLWNGSLAGIERVANADVFGPVVWSTSRQGLNIGVTYQSTDATWYPYFYLRNYTTSGWLARELVYNLTLPSGTAPIASANDTCWFVSWCRESPRSIHYRIRNSTGSWLPDNAATYYSLADTYGAPNYDFTDYASLQSSFFCYGNYLGFGYQYSSGAMTCVRYAFLDFNVAAGAWHDIATWTATLVTRQWIDVSTWTETLIARQWNTITTWTYDEATRQWTETATWTENQITRQWVNVASWSQTLITRLWREMATWQQDPITRMWHETTWLADLITLGWHDIALWTITLGEHAVPYIIPILFLGCLVGAIFIVAFMKKKG